MSAAAVSAGLPQVSAEQEYYNSNSADDVRYKELRQLANQAYQRRKQLSQQSQAAYKAGDKAKAHQLSEQAKVQLQKAENYSLEAAEFVFVANNVDSQSDEIDLHGLFVKESIWILQKRIISGIRNGEPYLKVIVGKGLHSVNGVAKLKPAVEELCQESRLSNYIDPKNAGVLIIDLQNATIPPSWQNIDYNNPSSAYQQYGKQSQPNYKPQAATSQSNTTGGRESLLVKMLKFVFICISKNA